tara:strand:+ start:859 stop:1056 length:198 start_codon:yes stop_codon:yes gene_type:complete
MADMKQPFTDEDKKRMDEHLLEIDEAEKLLARGKMAGLDLTDQETRLRETKNKLRQIKNTFFVNQ